MPWGAAIAAGGSILSGVIGAVSSKSAANTQASTDKYVADLQRQTQQENVARVAPFTNAGIGAINILSSLYGIPSNPLSVPTSAPSASTPVAATNPLASTTASGVPVANGGLPAGYQIVQNQVSGEGGGGFSLVNSTGDTILSGQTPSDIYAMLPTVGLAPGQNSAAPAAATSGTATQSLPGGIPGAPTTFAYNPAAYGLGNGVYNPADYGLGNGVFKPTEAELVQTPGYKFTLNQGLRSVQNSAAARGLGTSGAALKGAADYATGLADNTLRTQADIYNANVNRTATNYGNNVARTAGIFQTNLQNYINPLEYLGSLGESAGVQTGAQGIQSAANQGSALIAGGNAQAAGTVGAGNAISNGINSGINSYQNYQLYSALNKGNSTGAFFGNGTGAGGSPTSGALDQ